MDECAGKGRHSFGAVQNWTPPVQAQRCPHPDIGLQNRQPTSRCSHLRPQLPWVRFQKGARNAFPPTPASIQRHPWCPPADAPNAGFQELWSPSTTVCPKSLREQRRPHPSFPGWNGNAEFFLDIVPPYKRCLSVRRLISTSRDSFNQL